MGFKLKMPKIKIKAPKIKIKTGIKAVDNITSAATKAINNAAGGVVKIASGNVTEGFGDVGQAFMKNGIDIATLGNKSLVDSFTGGAMTKLEGAARGNSSDIISSGLSLASVIGPVSGIKGAEVLKGENMDYLNSINSFLGSDAGKLASQVVSGIGKKAPKPVKVVAAPAAAAPSSSSNDLMKYGMIGGGVLLIAVVAMMAMRK